MIRLVTPDELRPIIEQAYPGAVLDTLGEALLIRPERIVDVATLLKQTPELRFEMVNDITAVDWLEYFEIIYQFLSLTHHQRATLKVRIFDRDQPSVPSLTAVYRGANWQEREIYDLMGITFLGHPDLRRILLWEGFPGHPLRKDYFYENVPGKYDPHGLGVEGAIVPPGSLPLYPGGQLTQPPHARASKE